MTFLNSSSNLDVDDPATAFSTRFEVVLSALAMSVADASGDWLIFGGDREVENAPVDSRWSNSKSSCSSLGRRSGDGELNGGGWLAEIRRVAENTRTATRCVNR